MRALAVGIGNSTIRLAVMEDGEVCSRGICSHAEFRDRGISSQELAGGGELPRLAGVCSVVPEMTPVVTEALHGTGVEDVRHVQPREATWFRSSYRSMDTLGADRFAVALAAKELYGSPCVVIDCGTATTINVMDRDGRYLGGSIGVGVETAFAALHRGTAQLPDLSGSAADAPVIGRDTGECIVSGVLHTHCRALEGMAGDIVKITGPDTRIILTGGNAERLRAAGLRLDAARDDDLLLRGVIFYLLFTA